MLELKAAAAILLVYVDLKTCGAESAHLSYDVTACMHIYVYMAVSQWFNCKDSYVLTDLKPSFNT